MPDTATATLLFCDLVGSTARFSRVGDDAADGLRRLIFDRLRTAVRDFGGLEVKHLGDGLMVVFTVSAADAIGCAIAMQRAMQGLDPNDGLGPIELRVGISTGEVVSEEGDWFGTPVIAAARLCAAARPQVILVTDVVRSVAGTRGAYRFTSVGLLELKGLMTPVPASAVGWRSDPAMRSEGPFVVPTAIHRPPSHRRRIIVAATAVATVIALAAAIIVTSRSSSTASVALVAKPAGYTPRLISRPCDPALTNAESRTRCAFLVVPEDRAKPHGRQVQLAVSRAPATAAPRSGVPTISLGVSAPVDDLLNSPVRKAGDHITMAERGEIGSNPALVCTELNRESGEDLKWAATDPTRRLARDQSVRACHDKLVAEGFHLDAYGSRDIALDVRDLAYAMKLPKINVQAGLDDTQTAREIAVEAPTLVRAFVLEDVWPPYADFMDGAVGTGSRAYEQYLTDCKEQPACAAAFPHLDAALPRLYAQYTAHPVTVTVPNPNPPGTPLPVIVDGDRIAHTVIDAMADSAALPLLAATLQTGSPEVIAQFAALRNAWPDSFPFAAQLDRFCIDDDPIADKLLRQASVDAAPMFRSLVLDTGADACSNWSLQRAPGASAPSNPPESRAVPTLILAPELSPTSSPQWASDTARSFGGATVVQIPHLTEQALLNGPPCLGQLRLQFLQHPSASINPRQCIDSIPPIQFNGT